ncbi:MAG: WD40 repeat domain-containing protein [Dehalococcoidales bacterium]|nr:WD40 repeat domain-containing protein [Dehalococcoidales bacterium]
MRTLKRRTYGTTSVISLSLFVVVFVSVLSLNPLTYGARAADDILSWKRVPAPLEGDAGGWVLAEDADIMCLEISDDGTLYCHANPSSTTQTLFKSVDNGISWVSAGGVSDDIIAIAAVPGSSTELYYTTGSTVYKSADAGYTFIPLPKITAAEGTGDLHISCIDVYKHRGSNLIAVGTLDSDDAELGGVYIFDESEATLGWQDTNLGDYDVYELAFSPGYSDTGYLAAVVTDGMDTCISTRSVHGNWNQDFGQAVVSGVTPVSAVLTFPSGFPDMPDDRYLFVGLNTGIGAGDIYRIELETAPVESTVIDLDIGSVYGLDGVDVTGLDSGGSSSNWLFAGAADSTQVYRSENEGVNWTRCLKKPTGLHSTRVVLDNDFTDNNRIYAAAMGTEGGLSCSVDKGITWNQISLIDTKINSGRIVDLAVSPGYTDDKTMFMLTLDTNHLVHSVWRTENAGEHWERVFNSAIDNVDSVNKIEISPLYGTAEQVLYLTGTNNGTPVIWKTSDNGKTFTTRYTPLRVDEWLVVNGEKFIIGCYDGTNARIYTSSDSGRNYSQGAIAGNDRLTSMSVSPEYSQDGVVLAGNANGEIFYSEDSGLTFKLIPADSQTSPVNGRVHVAFDPGFQESNTVYAAGDATNNGIYRFTIDQSDEWERIDESLPEGGLIRGLRVSKRGILYAINSQAINVPNNKGGMERSLNPSSQLLPTFETIVKGLNEDSVLSGIWVAGDRIWTIDTTNTRLLTYYDTLASPVVLRTPLDGSVGIDTRNVLLDWNESSGATEYTWQVDYDGMFTSIPSDFEGETSGNSIRISELDMDTSYFWRVRAVKPILSPWSDIWSFTTTPGQTEIGPKLISPNAGSNLISLEPIFQWSAITGGDKYELAVSTDISFNNPVIEKTGRNALPATAWKSDVVLEENNTYYWKVRAIGSGSYSDWSAVSIFTTQIVETEEVSEPIVFDIKSPVILSPEAGSEKISVKPLFQWDAVLGADGYELVVSPDTSFENPIILKAGEYALTATAWKSNISLENNTTYYWKIRTLIDGSYSDWSRESAFSTGTPYEESKATVIEEARVIPVQSQTASTNEGFPDWALYLGIGLLIAIVLLQTTTFFIVVITRVKQY